MKYKGILIIISIIFTLSTIFFDGITQYAGLSKAVGLPFNFFWYMNTDLPTNRLLMFDINNLIKISFRIDLFILSVLVNFFIIAILYKIIIYIIKKLRNIRLLHIS